ncbi:type II toxin-antitoxin system RelE/ParE family toxin [Flavobacterium faecale]|uniref:type II toxin-antitoxin system RelE/ParE family toxin n=1 Tax=Flavobacterium faecale TaxID=1355330 RepID=UPI003AB01CFB
MTPPIKIRWDIKAKEDLKIIHDFIAIKSQQSAKKLVSEIIQLTKNIHFNRQYPIDEILGEPYRKITVKNYKIVYKIQSKTEIRILQIFDNRQNPNILKK